VRAFSKRPGALAGVEFWTSRDDPILFAPGQASRSGRHEAARARAPRIGRLGAVLRIVHQSIIAAKTNRLRSGADVTRRVAFGAEPDQHDPGQDAAKFPPVSLIIGDKWDF